MSKPSFEQKQSKKIARSAAKKPAKKAPRGTLKRVLGYLRGYRFYLILSLLLAISSVALTLWIPILVGEAIDHIVAPGAVNFTAIRSIFSKAVIAILLTAILQWLMNVCNNKMTYGVAKNIRNDAFRHLQKVPFSYLDSHKIGDVVSRLISDVDQFTDGLLLGFTQLFTGIATIVGTLIFMLTVHPGITLVVVLITPLSLFVASFIAKRTYKMFKLQSEIRGKQTALMEEAIGSHKVVAAFSQEQNVLDDFNIINKKLQKASLRATFFSSLVNPTTRFVYSTVYAGVALVGALVVMNPTAAIPLSIGGLSAFLSYANQYTKPFNEISGVITELQGSLACAARIFEVLDAPTEQIDSEKTEDKSHASGCIVFENVNFSYSPEKPLIQNLNLKIEEGMHVAIVGPTGCGKTTLINLLMRFYDVTGGAIKIGGKDVREIPRHELRRSIGMVLQDTWLKSGTVAENISFGTPHATREQIVEAAKAAHAHSFIKKLPQGYDTKIGEDGGSLSQGQKQLLCISRLMLSTPPMLILDEATSSIDTRTEHRIQRAFAALMRGRTSFVVAHRLSTIKESDLILVMKDGQVIEQGNHETLLAQKGFYHTLYHSQFAHTDE
ncbi:MAG: ABC transporter ATP-binding protein [Ruminococcaceae bacterium]|nr:ABC transporter ATP-binding protein [Oscillospiraceae bacterium]